MPFVDVIGQERAKALLMAWLEGQRMPHAVLMSGPVGTGKRRLALELAQALNCASKEACGQCLSCRKTGTLGHPDVHILVPLPSRAGERNEARLASQAHAAALDYIQRDWVPPRSNVNIARLQIRLLQREMVHPPVEGAYKIALIFEAERMHPAGANTMLKMLEEPPAYAVFVLVSSAEERMLPTVLSRCQRVPLQPLGRDDMRHQLIAWGYGAESLEVAVRLGRGNLYRARQVAEGAFDETRQRVEAFLQGGRTGREEAYWDVLDQVGKRAERGLLEDFLEMCGVYLRDLYLMGHGRGDEVANLDRRSFLQALEPSFTRERIEAAADEVDGAFARLDHNVNTNLLLVALWRRLRG